MFEINLPSCDIKLTKQNGKILIYDFLRRKNIVLTPEEWVRQHFTHYLVNHKGYPSARMANEVSLTYNGMTRRCDTVLYSREGHVPQMIMEYKAPHVPITQKVFDQIIRYNAVLQVPYLVVSNGLVHYACQFDKEKAEYVFLTDIPPFTAL